jgi:hypothetical protein
MASSALHRAWVLYQSFEAFHTAKASRDGLPLPDPFGLNEVGSWLNWAGTAGAGGNSKAAGSSAGAPYRRRAQDLSRRTARHNTEPPPTTGAGGEQPEPEPGIRQPPYGEPYGGPKSGSLCGKLSAGLIPRARFLHSA